MHIINNKNYNNNIIIKTNVFLFLFVSTQLRWKRNREDRKKERTKNDSLHGGERTLLIIRVFYFIISPLLMRSARLAAEQEKESESWIVYAKWLRSTNVCVYSIWNCHQRVNVKYIIKCGMCAALNVCVVVGVWESPRFALIYLRRERVRWILLLKWFIDKWQWINFLFFIFLLHYYMEIKMLSKK